MRLILIRFPSLVLVSADRHAHVWHTVESHAGAEAVFLTGVVSTLLSLLYPRVTHTPLFHPGFFSFLLPLFTCSLVTW